MKKLLGLFLCGYVFTLSAARMQLAQKEGGLFYDTGIDWQILEHQVKRFGEVVFTTEYLPQKKFEIKTSLLVEQSSLIEAMIEESGTQESTKQSIETKLHPLILQVLAEEAVDTSGTYLPEEILLLLDQSNFLKIGCFILGKLWPLVKGSLQRLDINNEVKRRIINVLRDIAGLEHCSDDLNLTLEEINNSCINVTLHGDGEVGRFFAKLERASSLRSLLNNLTIQSSSINNLGPLRVVPGNLALYSCNAITSLGSLSLVGGMLVFRIVLH